MSFGKNARRAPGRKGRRQQGLASRHADHRHRMVWASNGSNDRCLALIPSYLNAMEPPMPSPAQLTRNTQTGSQEQPPREPRPAQVRAEPSGHAAPDRERSVVLDILAGALAGAAGVWVMDRVDWFNYRRGLDDEGPPPQPPPPPTAGHGPRSRAGRADHRGGRGGHV